MERSASLTSWPRPWLVTGRNEEGLMVRYSFGGQVSWVSWTFWEIRGEKGDLLNLTGSSLAFVTKVLLVGLLLSIV
jgi:hypothetical protein